MPFVQWKMATCSLPTFFDPLSAFLFLLLSSSNVSFPPTSWASTILSFEHRKSPWGPNGVPHQPPPCWASSKSPLHWSLVGPWSTVLTRIWCGPTLVQPPAPSWCSLPLLARLANLGSTILHVLLLEVWQRFQVLHHQTDLLLPPHHFQQQLSCSLGHQDRLHWKPSAQG